MGSRVKLFLLYLISTLVITGCGKNTDEDYTKVEHVKSPLVLGVTSYLSVEEVKSHLSLGEDEFVITEQSESSKRANIPPFDILTAKIQNTEIEGFKGSVSITFFNGRLMEIRFFPKQFQNFVKSIPGLSNADTVDINPFTKVWTGNDYKSRQYVAWTDKRLEKQLNRWIKNFT